MRMAPEGCVVDVQLAICCGPAARARKPPRNHTGRTAFSNARARDSARFPRELLCTSQTLSFRCSQWGFQKTSSIGEMTPCGAFVGVQNETAKVEAATAWLTHRPKIITLPHLGPSPQAAPLRSKQGVHYQTVSLEACPQGPRRPIGIPLLVPCYCQGHICTSLAPVCCKLNKTLSALLDFLGHRSGHMAPSWMLCFSLKGSESWMYSRTLDTMISTRRIRIRIRFSGK